MILDYCGAGSRQSIATALELDPVRYAWQPKIDGCYVRVSTDRHGRIANVLTRAGNTPREASEFLSLLAGPPDAVLHGELEAHTEAGIRVAGCRGWRNLHLFDCTRAHGRPISSLPYSQRWGELHRAQSVIESEGAGRRSPWTVDDQGDAHDIATGRYMRPVPRDLRRVPIVPLMRGRSAGEELWRSFVEVGGGEGLVAVALDAPAGRRGAKRKVKATDTIDCRVLQIDGRNATLEHGGQRFVVSAKSKVQPRVGQVVEIAHDGWYESTVVPRFARMVRVRDDLTTPTPAG
jgi:hypothetical protein